MADTERDKGYTVDEQGRHILKPDSDLVKRMAEAREKHLEWTASIAPGFDMFVIDTDVYLSFWGRKIAAGSYFVRADARDSADTDLYSFVIDQESLAEQMGLIEEDAAAGRATKETGEDGTVRRVAASDRQHTFKANMEPLTFEDKDGRTRHVTLFEALAWLAINEVERTDGREEAQRLFPMAYYVKEDEGSGHSAPALPKQDTIKPHKQYDPDTKAVNLMTSPELFGEAGMLLDVAGAGERKQNKDVELAVSFSVDDGIELSRPISLYDRDVIRAVSSRWVAGNRNITPQQIAGDMGIKKPTKNQVRKVTESIELLRRVFGYIDFSEEARGHDLKFPDGTPVTNFVVDGHLIEAQGATMKGANGREVRGYILSSPPLLYQHAAAIGQVVSYPQRWLEFGEGSDTDKHILLKSQLLRQVSRIKNPKWKKSKNIRFTTDPKHPDRPCLFSRAGINQVDRHARKDAIEYVVSVLDDLKADGAIKGYTLNQRAARGGGKSTYGVTIKP